mmetsp:Transcript_34140/g.32564  ORF Transcript_34140/g.32564 Transcript_34140/m.32564 type:complete len:132 (-) Transcript_34140:521-916(-)
MIEPFAVGIGAVGGALSRWKLTTLSSKFGLTPWSTAGINMIGSFALGSIIAKESTLKRTKVLCLGTGFCGAFTTFSTFSVDIVLLLDKGLYARALGLLALTNIGSVGFALLGYKLFKKMPPFVSNKNDKFF